MPEHQRAATRADPMGESTKKKPEWYAREDLGQLDKNYSNLVNKKRQEKLNFNLMCIDSSLEAVVDSWTTGHYITPTTSCTDKQTANNPTPIKMPNGDIITSTHISLLPQHNTTYQTKHAKHTSLQAFKNPSHQSVPCVTTTVLQSSMKKGSQYMTKRQDR